MTMQAQEAYALIGERAAQLAENPVVRERMVSMIQAGSSKEDVERWVYMTAIATLLGSG